MAEQGALSFGGLLRRLREDAGLTQDELAEAARVSQRAISDLERGINRTARKDTAVLLSGALGLDGPAREVFIAAARGRVPPERIFQLQAAGLQPGFPPLRLLGNPALPNNLPGQLSSFIGRDHEVAEVRALVESSRLVTLTGAGGAGKTRLGLQVAAELLDGSGDGVWLTEMAAVTDQDGVPAAICEALRLAGQPGRPELEALLDALALQDVLIVLDNCEHLIGGCAKTAEAILRRCPKVHLLATSREPLGIGGEIIYRVPSLSLPAPDDTGPAAAGSCDAVALFADRATAQGVSLSLDEKTADLVVSVCRQLDGMPLAIELAAARLRSMSLSELLDRLDQRFRLLTGGSRTALRRQQTLQATVEWSHSLLTGAEQVLLGRLAVFAGRFDLDAAEAVCGFGDVRVPEIAGLLGSLVDKSLVVAEPALEAFRYRLLETIRLFAAEQLAEAGEGAAVAAGHCAHFLAVAEAAAPYLTGPEQGRWLARLDLDQANLRRAAQHAASHPDGTAVALRLGAALWRYWMARSREAEAFTLLAPTLQQPDARADPALFAAALFAAAMVGCFVDVQAARHFAEQAVQVARPLGDERLLISALAALGAAHFFAGDPEAGLPFGLEAVERARRLGDDVLLGMSLGIYAVTLGAIDPARCPPLYTEAFACTRRSGDHLLDCDLHLNSAIAAVSGGDLPAARAHLDAAARAARQIGWEHVYITLTLGDVQRAEGDIGGARFTWQAALRASRRNGDNPAMASACHSLAVLAGDAGDWHRAAVLHGAAQALIDRTGRPWDEDAARERRDSLRQARAHLGEEQLERAYAQDVALSLDQALDPARGKADPA